MQIPDDNNNVLDKLRPHEDEKSILKEQDIEDNPKDLVGKSLDVKSQAKDMISGCTPQNQLFKSKLLSSLREIRFTIKEFSTDTLVSNIKYYYPRLQNNNPFYLFHAQLDYVLAHYFAKFGTTKGNIDKFFFEQLMVSLTGKLSY